jgi:hypothetical protein
VGVVVSLSEEIEVFSVGVMDADESDEVDNSGATLEKKPLVEVVAEEKDSLFFKTDKSPINVLVFLSGETFITPIDSIRSYSVLALIFIGGFLMTSTAS